jgi:hypothetical protein
MHTLDLDYRSYFSAVSIDPATYFGSFCRQSRNLDVEVGTAADQPDQTKIRKPSAMPLAIFVGRECPVSVAFLRQSVEIAVSREGIEPLPWPAFEVQEGWFGVYVGLECDRDSALTLRLSFIDWMDGSLVLYDSILDGSEYIGLSPPGGRSVISYPSFIEGAVDGSVSRFVHARFDLVAPVP